ncbi:MAG: DEAD/DEAH box helicase [Nitrososphaeria archaeon]
MLIEDLRIPSLIKERLISKGYLKLWPPQEKAVQSGLLEGKNLLIVTPTASGKTLIALLATAKTVIDRGKKVIYITPLKALASEKYEEFKEFFEGVYLEKGKPLSVGISTGDDFNLDPSYLSRYNVIITTNERLDSIIRHKVKWLEKVGLFVFDEVHLLDDDTRGGTLEFVLTEIASWFSNVQVLALSATVKNYNEIASWLGMNTVYDEWRPVTLVEGVAYDDKLVYKDGQVDIIERKGTLLQDVVYNELKEGGQCLVFAETRKKALELAKALAYVSRKFSQVPLEQTYPEEEEDTTLTKTLRSLIPLGVAFHHAGLPASYRKLVERLFRENKLKVICSTPTLAAGVNLPARTVVINSVYRYNYEGREPIKVIEYKQMAGRAGRPKYDKIGKCIILAQDEYQVDIYLDRYISGEPEPITSKLLLKGTSSMVLALISVLGYATAEEIKEFFRKTLYYKQKGTLDFQISEALSFLSKNGFIMLTKNGKYRTTPLGDLTAKVYILPQTALSFIKVADELKKWKDLTLPLLCLLASSEDIEPKLSSRKKDEVELAQLLNANFELEPFFDEDCSARTFLALYGWVNELSEQELLDRFGVEPGDLYRIIESSRWIVYSYSKLARIVGMSGEAFDLPFIRIYKGVREDVASIASLSGIGRKRARALFEAGYHNILELSQAKEAELASKVKGISSVTAKKIIREAREKLGLES